jgi:Tfp pilus assembly protein PilO
VNRRTLLILVGGMVVLVALWFALLWKPQSQRLDAAHDRRSTAESENDELEVQLARLRDLEERRPELEDDLRELRQAVPDRPALAAFFVHADDAAQLSGVELTSVTPTRPAASTTATTTATTAPSSGGGGTTTTTAPATTGDAAGAGSVPSEIQVAIDIKGGYFQVLDFLNRIDDLTRIVVVDAVALSPGGSDDTSGTATGSDELTASITARMFTTTAAEADQTGTTGAATTPTTASSGGGTSGGQQ